MRLIKAILFAVLGTIALTFLIFFIDSMIPAYTIETFSVAGVSMMIIIFVVLLVLSLA